MEHNSEVNKAEHYKIFNDIAHIECHIKSINKDIDAVKEVLGMNEIDITILKRRSV